MNNKSLEYGCCECKETKIEFEKMKIKHKDDLAFYYLFTAFLVLVFFGATLMLVQNTRAIQEIQFRELYHILHDIREAMYN